MSRYRLDPTPEQEAGLRLHCAHARAMWNAGLELANAYRQRGTRIPGLVQMCRELTEARAGHTWLAAGASRVQQQALRDLEQAFRNCWNGTHRYPRWRRRGEDEGFRIVDG